MARRKHNTARGAAGFQLPLFQPQGDWRPTPVSQLPSWAGAKRVGIDIETKDPNLKKLGPGPRRDGRIAGVSFAIEDGPDFYLPVGHGGGDNLDPTQVFDYLKDQARHYDGDLGGANMNYDLDYLAEYGVWFNNVKFFRDVQIADPLIDELLDEYNLGALCERHGIPGKDMAMLKNAAMLSGIPEKEVWHNLWQLPARYVADYAKADARRPLEILRKQEQIIDQQELWQIYNLESKVLPVLVKMRRRGVRIDLDRLEGVERWCLYEETEALAKVKHQTGIAIPVGSVWQPTLIAPALEQIGVKVGRTAKGAPNIDKIMLDRIDHPVAEAILWARKVNKLRTTFAASIRDHMCKGRIHCVFNQIAREDEEGAIRGARYGRLSSEHPNMQQQPARDEFAKRWRSIYRPDTDFWMSADYSQQEPRVLTHYAVLADCSRAQEAADKYRNDPNTDNHQMMADLTGLKRSYAKIVYLGLCYGMGGAKLARDLKLPTKVIEVGKADKKRKIEVAGNEAQTILDTFNDKAPFIKELAKRCEEVAFSRGFIVTVGGRRCRFPKDALGNFDWCHKALNRLIQGSSADQTKTAMVMCDAAGHELQLQVHDELDGSVRDDKQAEEIGEIMRTCVPLQVPSKVDVEIGPSWGEVE